MNYLILGKQVFNNNLSGTKFTEKLIVKSDKDLSDEELIKKFERHLVLNYVKEGWDEEEYSTWSEEEYFDVYDENGVANHVDYIFKTPDMIPNLKEVFIDDDYDAYDY